MLDRQGAGKLQAVMLLIAVAAAMGMRPLSPGEWVWNSSQ